MDALKEKHLRPGRRITDQFLIATALTAVILGVSVFIFPIGAFLT